MVAPWVWPAAITTAATVGSSLLKGKKAKQGPMMPDEQIAAMQALLKFGQTGSLEGTRWHAGEDLGLPLGDWEMTPEELASMGRLSKLMAGGLPGEIDIASGALRGLVDPSAAGIEGRYLPFKAIAEREIGTQEDALKRSAAFGGSLYGTSTIRGLGDVRARGVESMHGRLAELMESDLNRRLMAAQALAGVGGQREQLELGRIGAGQTFGALPRVLRTQKAQAEYQEALRRRQEKLAPLEAYKSIMGAPTQYGFQSATVPSPWQQPLGSIAEVGMEEFIRQLFKKKQ